MSDFCLIEDSKTNEKLMKENVILHWKLYLLEKRMLKLKTIYKWRLKSNNKTEKEDLSHSETQTQKQGFLNIFINELNTSMEEFGGMVDNFINKNI